MQSELGERLGESGALPDASTKFLKFFKMNDLNDVWFWAKVAGLCSAMLSGIDEDGKVWLSEDDKDMLKVLSEIKPSDAIKLAGR